MKLLGNILWLIIGVIAFNRKYVASRGYEKHITDKFPDKKLAVLSCMDTRLSVLLQEALGLKNGDAKVIKNAGAVIPTPWDSAMRSLISFPGPRWISHPRWPASKGKFIQKL